MRQVPFVKYIVQNSILLVYVSTNTTLAGSELVMTLKNVHKHHSF